MARIAIRVDDDKKERWGDAVEENREYDSMTHLIELAVHKELSDSFGSAGGAGGSQAGGGYDPEVTNAELYERQRDLAKQLKEVRDTAKAIKQDTETTDSRAMMQVYQRLPSDELEAVTPQQMADSMEKMDRRWAAEILEELTETTGRVHTVTIEGDDHYYRN